MKINMKYDAYKLENHTFTRAGLPLHEAARSLRVFIAEGDQDHAIDIAYDMYRTSTYILRCLWKELFRTTLNVIGMAEPYALDYIYNLYRICYDCEPYMPESGGMMALSFIHAIRYLCRCSHDSSVSASLDEIEKAFADGETAGIPSFAYDHHNHEGRKLGHNPLDFLDPDGGSYVANEVPGLAEPYKARLRELLSSIYGGPDPKPFMANGYNHYYEMESRNGLNLELMQSAFQKSIRRGLERESLKLAYEAITSGSEMEDYLWERVVIMSVEDVGMGDPDCNRLMYSCSKIKDLFLDDAETRILLLFFCVIYLCRSRKERSTELIKGILVQEFKAGKKPILAEPGDCDD